MVVWLKQANIVIWKSSPQYHISFYKVFFDKKHSKPPVPKQVSLAETLWDPPPQTLISFLILPLGLKVSPQAERGRGWYCEEPEKSVIIVRWPLFQVGSSQQIDEIKNERLKDVAANEVCFRIVSYVKQDC